MRHVLILEMLFVTIGTEPQTFVVENKTAPAFVVVNKVTVPPATPATDPSPIGSPPGPNFRWRHLPGVGWGWVQDGVTAPAAPRSAALAVAVPDRPFVPLPPVTTPTTSAIGAERVSTGSLVTTPTAPTPTFVRVAGIRGSTNCGPLG